MSRFVSRGTDDNPTERDEEWLSAQKAVEARTVAKLKEGVQEGGLSLYETLQANKAAKQEAFEESIRLKHQFRSLDEDDIQFLDGIEAAARAKQAEARREANVELQSFRNLQQEAEKTLREATETAESDSTDAWTSGTRKRKKQKDAVGLIKKRQAVAEPSPQVQAEATKATSKKGSPETSHIASVASRASNGEKSTPVTADSPIASKPPALGLTGYSSDEED